MLYSFISSTNIRYDEFEFKELLIDFDDEIEQLKTLQKIISMKLDETTVESANFVFDIDNTFSIDMINLNIFMRKIAFHIVRVNTSFLLYLVDMNKLDAFFNNLINQVVQTHRSHSVIRRYDHAFLLWCTSAYAFAIESFSKNSCFLIIIELRRLYRRFEHFSIFRLHQI